MPITKEQRELRRNYIGSSDAAAVLGLDPYRSPIDLYYEKTGQIEKREETSDATEVGNVCERAVLFWFAEKKKIDIELNFSHVHENKIMAANLDAVVVGDPTQAIEAKTTGVLSYHINEQWGEVGTDEVPDRVALQCQHQMAVVPTLQIVWVPVLMGGVGLRYYYVERDDEMIKDLTDAELNFWNNHVKPQNPPSGLPSLDVLKSLKRQPAKTISLDESIATIWLEAKAQLKVANERKESAERMLLTALGDAEGGSCSLGEFTYLERQRKAYTVQETKYRQLSFKKPKE